MLLLKIIVIIPVIMERDVEIHPFFVHYFKFNLC